MGYFLSLSKSATITWLDTSEWLLLLFGIVLVVGIVGEIRLPDWHHRLKTFEILVLVGVLGELAADGGIFFFSSHLQTISEAEKSAQDMDIANLGAKTALAQLAATIADARAKGFESQIADSNARVKTAEAQVASANAASREAVARVAEASAKAEGFRLDIAKANENASNAQERAAKLQLEGESLRKELSEQGSRSNLFSGQEQERFISRLRVFAGQKVQFRICFVAGGVYESREFFKLLQLAVKKAGWSMVGSGNLGMACQTTGIWVGLNATAKASARTREAAKALLGALASVPLAAEMHPDFNTDPRDPDGPSAADPDIIIVVVLLHPL
jgi:hypothetical protein